MTSRVEGLIRKDFVAALAVLTVGAFGWAAQANAQAPPAAVDQYKPAPPGNPNPDPDRPGRPDGGPGSGDPGSPDPGELGPGGFGTPAGEVPPAGSGDDGEAAGGGAAGNGSGSESDSTADDSGYGSAPTIAGYPLTSALVAALVALAIGLCAAGGVAMWRRRRTGAALAG